MAARSNRRIYQFDVRDAYLNADLEEEVYVEAPRGVFTAGTVWRLHKALPGLKQAALAWYEKLGSVLGRDELSINKGRHLCFRQVDKR
jgi:hypothetical protein